LESCAADGDIIAAQETTRARMQLKALLARQAASKQFA